MITLKWLKYGKELACSSSIIIWIKTGYEIRFLCLVTVWRNPSYTSKLQCWSLRLIPITKAKCRTFFLTVFPSMTLISHGWIFFSYTSYNIFWTTIVIQADCCKKQKSWRKTCRIEQSFAPWGAYVYSSAFSHQENIVHVVSNLHKISLSSRKTSIIRTICR